MPIVLTLPSSPDAIATYEGLVDAICYTLKDDTLATHAPRFIYLAEARFKRLLNTLDQEASSTATAAASIALPSDYKHLRSVRIDDSEPLRQLSPDDFRTRFAEMGTAKPEAYCIQDGALLLGPAPDSAYALNLSYVRTLTNLSDTVQTNWLIERSPDLYLYGAIAHAELFGWNDERLPLFESAVDTIIAEINAEDALRRRGQYVADVAGAYF